MHSDIWGDYIGIVRCPMNHKVPTGCGTHEEWQWVIYK